jgi:predicted glycosyltransferase
VLVVPRTAGQRGEYEALARRLPAVRLLAEAIDGPALIGASDLVVCGGGTMLREAAVLGVPAVSIFSGPLGAVDRWLMGEGRVTLVRGDADADRVRLQRRPPRAPVDVRGAARAQIVQGICDTAAGG